MKTRYKPVGWRGESRRHYLAAKGIKTKYNADKWLVPSVSDEFSARDNKGRVLCPRCKLPLNVKRPLEDKQCNCQNEYYAHKYYAYTPTYVAGDLPVMGADAVGTAGAATVEFIPIVVPLALLYGGVKLAKKHKDKTGHWYLADKKESDEEFAARTGFEPFDPFDPRVQRRPEAFKDLPLEDKERFVRMEQRSLSAARAATKDVEELNKTSPEYVKTKYGPIADEFKQAEYIKQLAAREAFLKAVTK